MLHRPDQQTTDASWHQVIIRDYNAGISGTVNTQAWPIESTLSQRLRKQQ